jgi:hypothetical protein
VVQFTDVAKFESYGTTIAFGSVWIGGRVPGGIGRVVQIPLEALSLGG